MIIKALLGLKTSSDDPQKNWKLTNDKAPASNLCVGFATRTTTQHKMQMTFKCRNKFHVLSNNFVNFHLSNACQSMYCWNKVLLLRLRDFMNNFIANKNVKACIEGQELVQRGVLCFKEHHVRFVTRDYNFIMCNIYMKLNSFFKLG